MAQMAEVRRPRWKVEEVEELARLLREYKVVATFELRGLRANIIHEMRKLLRDKCIIKVSKKNLFLKACDLAGRPELKAMVEDVKAPIGFILSSISSFRLAMLLEKSRVPMFAKAGERADFDVWVSEMNTGLPPGPILSDFGKLKIPTRIEGGQGDEISPLLASMLVKLGVKSVLRGLTISRAYEDGVILTEEHLRISLEDIANNLKAAYSLALSFASEVGYISHETIGPMVIKSLRNAMALAVALGYVSRETLAPLVIRAEREASLLSSFLESRK
jgi:large subunit ribosomal protein L10